MKIKPIHPNFKMPVRSTAGAGAYDLFMPSDGVCQVGCKCALGFSAEVPAGHVALVLPRSGVGFKYGLELNNTCGVIDSDYRGEWMASLRTKDGEIYRWKKGDRLLQMLIVPVAMPVLELVDELGDTERGEGGFGSTGD